MKRLIPLLGLVALVPACTVTKGTREETVGIPPGAVQVKEGTGSLSYSPDRVGHVYVYDVDNQALVFERAIRNDDRVTIDPNDDRVQLNGATVVNRKLPDDHKYRVYFKRD